MLLRTAWVCDDAYISFRTVDNFVHGYGLRWNVDERVQAFTHPLWLFLVASLYAVTREPWLTSIALSFVLSLATAGIIAARIAATPWHAVLALLALVLSKAFVDFSSSGLENPLTHVLLAALVSRAWLPPGQDRKTEGAAAIGCVSALAALNRLDVLLLVAPISAAALMARGRRAAIAGLMVAAAPVAAWECFSIFYYGYAFPNTAYAKLATGIPSAALVEHGLLYFEDSMARDPVTLLVIACGVVAGMANRHARPAVAGITLYLLYIVRIGGDFMSGRFFAAPFVVAVAVLASHDWLSRRTVMAAAVAALAIVGWVAREGTVLSDGYYSAQEIPVSGIADERGFYYQTTGLLRKRHEWQPPPEPLQARYEAAIAQGRRAIVADFIGRQGFLARRRIHIVDRLALTDPLLSRLPSDADWRIGHFPRTLPEGYFDSLETGTNRIADPDLARYYEKMTLITRGPLWSRPRVAAIAGMNAGRYDEWLRAFIRRTR